MESVFHTIGQGRTRSGKKLPGWHDELASDIGIARRCGWTLDYVRSLDPDDYDAIVETLNAEHQRD